MTHIEHTYEDIRACLAFHCELSGLTQAAIAEDAGISKSALCLILNGKRRPSLTILFKICSAINQPPEYIIFPDLDKRHAKSYAQN